eukprot:4473675-Amphidinium_carterae.1
MDIDDIKREVIEIDMVGANIDGIQRKVIGEVKVNIVGIQSEVIEENMVNIVGNHSEVIEENMVNIVGSHSEANEDKGQSIGWHTTEGRLKCGPRRQPSNWPQLSTCAMREILMPNHIAEA